MDIEALADEWDGDSKPTKLEKEYTVGVSKMTTHILAGANYKIEDMDRKMRDIKLKRIL